MIRYVITSEVEDIVNCNSVIFSDRAATYGWSTTYHFSKAMAEMVLHETRGDIPVLVIRPSVIESCYKEPQPGWIEGNR